MSASSRTIERPASVTAAVGLLVVLVAVSIPAVIVMMDGFDAAFVAIAATLATLKLIAAGGLWRCRKWALYVGFGATLLDTLLGLGSIAESSSSSETALIVTTVVIGIATLVLLVLPNSRRAYA
jgi:hypothetical protein